MAAMQPEGAAQAAQLSGLSLQAGLALAMQRRQFTECAAPAFECIASLADV